MKKLILALAVVAILSPIFAQAEVIIYKTFQEAWAVCTNGDVSAYYANEGGRLVMKGWICTIHERP